MPAKSSRSRARNRLQGRPGVPKTRKTIAIVNITPTIDCGRYPIKRIVGDIVRVQADILKPGHDKIYSALYHRPHDSVEWVTSPMSYSFNEDIWSASFPLTVIGTHEFFIEAWTDRFGTLLDAVQKWHQAGEDVSSDLEEIRELLKGVQGRAKPDEVAVIAAALDEIDKKDITEALRRLQEPSLSTIVNRRILKQDANQSSVFEVFVDQPKAQFSAWYEMFHRSQGTVPGKSATFADCEKRLDEIKTMGFDVIYLPPIHPIGTTNRRGQNNKLEVILGDPGSPWAIGNANGGHDAVNEELGTMDEFSHFVAAAKERDIDIALDIAFQCSPDHPYVKNHPEWFRHRKDGSIRYAENPPKKYFDIYPLNFESKSWPELWEELARIVLHWAKNGVRCFRVDNPHTKPIDFWEWLIRKVKAKYPDTIFLSEAFTRPNNMKLLAKIGFTQSYTYFTWKNTKYELTEWLTDFMLSDISEYYRGNLFTNTPDILTEFLQRGGRPAFKIRLVLAATLSSAYGIYNGFELCESAAKATGSEEYADSEKYQYKVWDWDRPGNIKDYIAKINTIRIANPALHETRNLHLLGSDSEHVLFYGKWTQDRSNIILVAVNLDPNSAHDSIVHVPSSELGFGPYGSYTVRDLITGNEYQWHGDSNYVKLDPSIEPAHVFLVAR